MAVYIFTSLIPIILFPMMSGKGIDANEFSLRKDRYIACALFLLFMISTMRADIIGADFRVYVQIFESNSGWYRSSEFLYGALNKVAYVLFHGNYVGLSFFINLLIFVPLYYHLKENTTSKYVALCLLIFVLNPYMYIQTTFNAIRQGCATGILMVSINYLKDKKWIKYILLTIIAYFFHKVAIVFLLLIPLRFIKWSNKSLFIVATVSLVMNLVFKNAAFMSYFIELFNFGSYSDYKATRFDIYIFSIFVFSVICFFLYHYKRLYKNEDEKFFVDMYILSLCMLLLVVKNDQAYRIYMMFLFLFLPAVEILTKNLVASKFKIPSFVPLVFITYYSFMLILFFLSISGTTAQPHYYPFKFFFQ